MLVLEAEWHAQSCIQVVMTLLLVAKRLLQYTLSQMLDLLGLALKCNFLDWLFFAVLHTHTLMQTAKELDFVVIKIL